jgi:GT2 family glycosyltransferase
MNVSIVIVHYNTPELTRNCIQSVLEKTNAVSYEIIVVDNASTVHDVGELKEEFPSIHLIKSKVNLGFARGNNLGIKEAKGKYILLLNSDTVLINDAISLAYAYMEEHKTVGVISAQLQYPDGRIQSVCQRFPSIKYSAIELLRLQKLMPAEKKGRVLLGAFFDHKATVQCDWVWGAFFFFRSEVLEKLPDGKLNEDYFMYIEDMQWCMDIRRLGYEVHYFPDAKLIHYMGGSSGSKNELMQKNTDDFLKKNYSLLERVVIKGLNKLLA